MIRKISLVLTMCVVVVAAASCTSTSTTATTATSGPSATSGADATTTAAPDDTKKTPGTGKTTGTSRTSSTSRTTGTGKTTGTGRTSGTSRKPTTKSPITKPQTTTSIEKSKLPTKSQSADAFGGLTQEESDCVDTVIYSVVTDDPTIADDDYRLAGATGGALVACVDADKLAAALVNGLRQTPAGGALSPSDLACVEGALSTGGDEEAYLIGALIVDDPAVIADAVTFYEDICGVALV